SPRRERKGAHRDRRRHALLRDRRELGRRTRRIPREELALLALPLRCDRAHSPGPPPGASPDGHERLVAEPLPGGYTGRSPPCAPSDALTAPLSPAQQPDPT